MIKDPYGRPIKSLRISVTPRCNFDCLYCHHEGAGEEERNEMTPEEIRTVTEVCADLGMEKVKITGGEPLVRKDVIDIVQGISSIEGIKEVSMTTNGAYLGDRAGELKEAGLDRVNISLDTLDPDTFSWITNGGNIERVREGISAAVDAGLKPVKINMVAMKGINDSDIWDMVHTYSLDGVVIQLIELMVADREFFDKYFFELDDIESEIESKASNVRTRKYMQDRKQYRLNGASVEVVKPMHNTDFCGRCTRMRVTADGRFKPCLMRFDNLVDFLTPLRAGETGEDLKELLLTAVNNREPYFKRA